MDKNKQEPKCKVGADGMKRWYLNGKYHREDGPAVEYASGMKYWYLNGEFHREDGPAVEYASGMKQWWLNGRFYYHTKQTEYEQVHGLVCWLTAVERITAGKKKENK